MAKTKETPWTSKKKMYKDGDPDVFREFNWMTWKRMTDPERAMWTEFSAVERAPIPKEVIDFEKKIEDLDNVAAEESIIGREPTEEEIKDQIKDQLRELGIRFTHNSKLSTLQKKLADAIDPE